MLQSQDLQRKISLFTIFSFLFYTFINVLLLSLPYFQLDLDTQIFSETLRNWSSHPILHLTVSTICPDGYQPLTPTHYWPGISSGCWCNSANPSIHSNSCTSAELSSGCIDIPSDASKSLNSWGSKGGSSVQICFKRSSETWTEVSEVSIKTCPSGYRKCGASWENIYCTKETVCPITTIQILPMTSTDQTKCLASPLLCAVLDDSATNPRMIQFRRGDSFDGMPIVDVRINEYGMCDKLSQDNVTPNRLQFPLLNIKEEYCSGNSQEDVPWEKVDEMTESSLFDLNGLTSEITSLNGFSSSGMTGYYQTGKTGDDYKWGIFTRPYFPWKTSCREDFSKIIEKIKNMNKIKTIQMLVMVFGITAGFLFGVVMTFIEIQQMRRKKIFFVNMNWENEKCVKKFWLIKDIMAGLCGILQIPVQVWSLVVVGTTRSLFISAYKRNCTGIFAENLNNFALEKLTQCFACTVISFAMTGILLAIYYGLARQRNKGLKGGNGGVRVVPVESSGEMSVLGVNNDRSEMVLITGNSQGGFLPGRIGVVGMRENEGVGMRRRIR